MRLRQSIFVDAGNMFYAQRRCGWHIDWGKAKRHLMSNCIDAGCYYFTAIPPAGNQQSRTKYFGFRAYLIGCGYTVIDKETRTIRSFQSESGAVTKGNLDVEMAFRIAITIENFDKCFIFSGDADFVSVVQHLRNIGKEVVCIAERATTGLDMINFSSSFVDLNELREFMEKSQ